jgi:crossover junction endonuclease MUS81|tara:strand:- start:283 stop:768 length:486 start_codon:yes stop_codon:yes gene_type:complete
MDDDIVILSDDEDDAAPFRDDNARFVDDFVARSGNRQREHPAMSTCSGRQLRLPPFPRGVAFKDVYDVVLIVDNREQFGGARRGANQTRADHRQEEVQRIASTHGILAEVGHLECGDATWVARRKPHHPGPQNDFVLDFVVERYGLAAFPNPPHTVLSPSW